MTNTIDRIKLAETNVKDPREPALQRAASLYRLPVGQLALFRQTPERNVITFTPAEMPLAFALSGLALRKMAEEASDLGFKGQMVTTLGPDEKVLHEVLLGDGLEDFPLDHPTWGFMMKIPVRPADERQASTTS